ncbi:MAG: hypothetical protein ACM3XO_24970 [Bacteroidota bacterium]|jgi:hypothetical protein
MNEAKRKSWNDQKLDELYPPFCERIRAVILELEEAGLRPRIHQAWRSEADQLKAFKDGFSQLKYGFHNVTKDHRPEALAVDMVDDDLENHKKTVYGRAEFLLRLTAAARKQALTTGIDWGLENFPGAVEAIARAITEGDWQAPLKHFGWDPAHIQPTGITPEEARAGKRPF